MNPLCVVTGTSSGIGGRLAEALLESGRDVVGIARRESALTHSNYQHVQLDLSDVDAMETFFQGAFLEMSSLPARPSVALINNAALLPPVGNQNSIPAGELARAFLVNSAAPIWLMGFFNDLCREVPLHIINISSGAAFRGVPGWTAYCSTKAALRMAGMVFEVDQQSFPEYKGRKGKITMINYSPGTVATDMQAQIRGYTPSEFPLHERFVGFHEKGELKSIDQPVEEILMMLQRDDLKPYNELYYGDIRKMNTPETPPENAPAQPASGEKG